MGMTPYSSKDTKITPINAIPKETKNEFFIPSLEYNYDPTRQARIPAIDSI